MAVRQGTLPPEGIPPACTPARTHHLNGSCLIFHVWQRAQLIHVWFGVPVLAVLLRLDLRSLDSLCTALVYMWTVCLLQEWSRGNLSPPRGSGQLQVLAERFPVEMLSPAEIWASLAPGVFCHFWHEGMRFARHQRGTRVTLETGDLTGPSTSPSGSLDIGSSLSVPGAALKLWTHCVPSVTFLLPSCTFKASIRPSLSDSTRPRLQPWFPPPHNIPNSQVLRVSMGHLGGGGIILPPTETLQRRTEDWKQDFPDPYSHQVLWETSSKHVKDLLSFLFVCKSSQWHSADVSNNTIRQSKWEALGFASHHGRAFCIHIIW